MNVAIAAPEIVEKQIICHQPVGFPPKVTAKRLAPRLETLDGKTIYLVDVRFDDSIELLKRIERWFASHMPSVKVKLVSMAGYYNRNDPELWSEIKANGHAAIIGVGHCSTCSPSVATHGVTMETKYEIPTVAIHTSMFDRVARAVTRMGGLPDAPSVFVPQPVMGKNEAELAAYVEGLDPVTGRPVMQEIIEALTRDLSGRQPAQADRSTPRLVEPGTKRSCTISSCATIGPTSCRSSCRPRSAWPRCWPRPASPPTRSSAACSPRTIAVSGSTRWRRSR